MNRVFISLCTSAITWAPFLLTACPALRQGQIPCESSLDCPTSYGCGSNKICSQGVAESELTIEPSKASVVAPGTTTFTAKLDGQNTANITWSVEGTGTGTIDASGKYTAPPGVSASMKVTIWAALKRHPDLKASATVTVQPPDNTVAWVMSYFRTGSPPKSVAQDSLYLAYSTDGLKWSPLGRSTPAYQLTLTDSSNHLRDPFILRKRDGTFVVLATDWTRSYGKDDYWSSPSPNIIVIDSADLITFTNPRLLPVTPIKDANTGIPMHAWAPEAFYDPDREQYGILWAGNDVHNVNRIYVSYTTDFQTLVNPDPIVFFDPGYSVIDATLVRTDTHNYLFFKDETENNGGPSTGTGKDVQIARSPSTALTPQAFSRWSPDYVTRGSDQFTQVRSEGPFVVKQQQSNTWYMCADLFDLGSFGCWSTTDLDASPGSWKRLGSADFAMPPNAQHGNTVRVTQAELDALISSYGTGTVKIKSTFVDSSNRPLYVAHSWNHGIITYDTDTTGGQKAGDFYFEMGPGLANPEDPSLVSFASTNFPGLWLLVNSANPTAWPEGRSLAESNQSQYMSQIPAGNKDHLLWLDEFQSSAAFAKDATFKIVPALNGNTSMVSLRWCGDSMDGTCNDIADPRYLCYSYFQVFAFRTTDPCGIDPNNPQSTTTAQDAMSFTILNQK